MTIITTGTFGDKFNKNLSNKLKDIISQVDMDYVSPIQSALGVEQSTQTALFKEVTSDNARETYNGLTALGFLDLTNEGDDYVQDSNTSTYETDFRPKKYTKKITVTEEHREDRIVDRKLDEARQLVMAAKRTRAKHAFDLINSGFTAQNSLQEFLTYYGDGVPMFSTLHPLRDSRSSSTTDSNASSTSIPLNEVNLEVARQELRRQKGDNGLPMDIGSSNLILVVPDSLEKTAVIITQSQLRSNTANNDVNIYDGMMTVISSKWLNADNGGSDTGWYLIDSQNSPFKDVVFTPEKVRMYETDSNHNFNLDIMFRHQVGNVDWRGIWGSKGDGSAYTS